MLWTMPRQVLRIVALLLMLAFASSFALGVMGQLNRSGHLPGDRILSGVTGAAPVDAPDAVPLSDERIEGAPPPAEDKAKDEKDEAAGNAVAPAAAVGNATAASAAAAAPPPTEAPAAGNAADAETPQDEPPH
jgi:hypothetical protein